MWSNDHEDRFPWQAPAAHGGTKEFAHLPYAALHFVVVSNEFNSPKILTCPNDTNRIRANVWEAPLHLSLSYFAGLNADETKPDTTLSGDRNISTNSSILVGLFDVQNPEALQWTGDIHRHAGNIALADGSVSQTTTETVRKTFRRALATNNSIRLAIP
jgi:prepilin-type processing-associated H-X9-DG protein